MKRQWPLGSEVKRKELTGGAMLYDASRAGNLAPAWFDPNYWKERHELDGEARGRGTVHFILHGGTRLVLRHYRRGGLIARVSKDRYFWRGEQQTRSFSEWQLTYHLHRAGLPVPAPIAARYQRSGLFYRADLITERIENSEPLAQRLLKGPLSLTQWIAVGRCIRRFHDAGVCHADLNAHNILLTPEQVYLIDFDRGTLRKRGWWADTTLVRLYRSLEKVTLLAAPESFSDQDWHSLLAGYRESAGLPQPSMV
jgi:3-deoxy-D-manno-octulosonic acid kinase